MEMAWHFLIFFLYCHSVYLNAGDRYVIVQLVTFGTTLFFLNWFLKLF